MCTNLVSRHNVYFSVFNVLKMVDKISISKIIAVSISSGNLNNKACPDNEYPLISIRGEFLFMWENLEKM